MPQAKRWTDRAEMPLDYYLGLFSQADQRTTAQAQAELFGALGLE
jgi:hypothetical protein